ncbi:MAG: signal peptide peptidase SppA, type, protease [Parcubacteria group bacterium]|nr:signal peptide peptidase SppA, type, protease [Parcubacteria group bacterium]
MGELVRKLGGYLKGLAVLIALFIFIGLASLTGVLATNWIDSFGSSNTYTRAATAPFGTSCNTVGIEIHGCIATYVGNSFDPSCDTITSSQDVVGYIDQAKRSGAKGILLDIDSPGGEPQAAAEIGDALHASGLPSVAWIRGYGDSAAYWVASAATSIVAASSSDVGSIGVTQSYVDNSKQDANAGITYNQLTTGKYKDTGSPDKPLTTDERAYLQSQLQILLDQFISSVSVNRHLSEETVRGLSDGSSMLGEAALQKGLVDKLGFEKDAQKELERLTKEKPVICWPQYSF